MSYSGTAQERCLRLVGKKMLVSLALEGKLANHGLTAMEEDEDVLTALARELVTEQGIGECAAAMWKTLKQQHRQHPAAAGRLVSAASAEEASLLVPVERQVPTQPAVTSERAQQLAFAF
jgi:hypothetical protein